MMHLIQEIATAMMSPSKGILAADESQHTMQKRFALIGLEQNSENDRRYRNMLFTTAGIEHYLSGIILHDETIHQNSDNKIPFATLLSNLGILPGIKVDQGLTSLESSPDEKVSIGLEGLADRLEEYYSLGARFTKWRSVISIGDDLPTQDALKKNADVLAEYAEVAQSKKMVPIVEPEVLFDGKHTLARSGEVLRDTLQTLYKALAEHEVTLNAMILKTSMALPGKKSDTPLDPSAIAEETIAALRDTVPADVAGVVFLSGGQMAKQATSNLNAIAKLGVQSWPITFSYSRAIEEPVIATWRGDEANRIAAQNVLLQRLEDNVAARNGIYVPK